MSLAFPETLLCLWRDFVPWSVSCVIKCLWIFIQSPQSTWWVDLLAGENAKSLPESPSIFHKLEKAPSLQSFTEPSLIYRIGREGMFKAECEWNISSLAQNLTDKQKYKGSLRVDYRTYSRSNGNTKEDCVQNTLPIQEVMFLWDASLISFLLLLVWLFELPLLLEYIFWFEHSENDISIWE